MCVKITETMYQYVFNNNNSFKSRLENIRASIHWLWVIFFN